MKRRRFLVMCLILALMTPWASRADPTPAPELVLEVEKQGLDFYVGTPTIGAVFALDDGEVETGMASTLPFLSYRVDVGPIENVDPTLSAGVEYIEDATYLGGALTVDLSGPPAWLLGKATGAIFGDGVASAITNATFVQVGVMGGGKIAGDAEAPDWRADFYAGGGISIEF